MIDFQDALINWAGRDVMAAAEAHAIAEFPKESCGFIAAGVYVACQNMKPNAEEEFRIDDPRYTEAVLNGTIEAIVHSHPHGPVFPSARDMQQQIVTDVPWIIITLNEKGVSHRIGWGGSLPVAPLLGRPFIHGIFDCYSAVRDVYRLGREQLAEQGIEWPLDPIELPDVARDDAWWASGQDLYVDGLAKYGFKQISRSEVRPGDGFLIKIGDYQANPHDRLNHAGVLLEKEMLLHHLPTRVCRREPAAIWARAADMWVRYEGPR